MSRHVCVYMSIYTLTSNLKWYGWVFIWKIPKIDVKVATNESTRLMAFDICQQKIWTRQQLQEAQLHSEILKTLQLNGHLK